MSTNPTPLMFVWGLAPPKGELLGSLGLAAPADWATTAEVGRVHRALKAAAAYRRNGEQRVPRAAIGVRDSERGDFCAVLQRRGPGDRVEHIVMPGDRTPELVVSYETLDLTHGTRTCSTALIRVLVPLDRPLLGRLIAAVLTGAGPGQVSGGADVTVIGRSGLARWTAEVSLREASCQAAPAGRTRSAGHAQRSFERSESSSSSSSTVL